MGDWKHGEQLAHDGAGDRIQSGRLENRKENGGLCQNCHALEPGEVNVGNRQITGVAAGMAPNDAVNVSQLGAVAVQTCPFFVNILYRAPLKIGCTHTKLHTVGMAGEHHINLFIFW